MDHLPHWHLLEALGRDGAYAQSEIDPDHGLSPVGEMPLFDDVFEQTRTLLITSRALGARS